MINQLIECDCMEHMKTVPDKYYDLAIVDVPYGIKQGGDKNKTRGKLAIAKDYHSFCDDKPPESEYFKELFRISKNQIIWGANHFIHLIPFDSSCWIVWDKVNGDTDFADCELAWTSFDSAVRIFRFMWNGMCQGKLSDGTKMEGDKIKNEKRINPCQKPVALYKWLLTHYAHPGDKLFDSHSGSGSFRIAAYDMGFDLVSCEKDHDYCVANEKRYQEHIQQQELIPISEIQQLTFGEK